MEILGVGPMELLLILMIALIILGPNDMVKTGKTIGRTLRRIVKSPMWATIQETSRGIRTLPHRLMREAGLEEEINGLKQTQEELRQQVDQVMRIKAPLRASAKEINDELHKIGGDLSGWTTPLVSQATSGETGIALDESGLSAWINPPTPANAGPLQTEVKPPPVKNEPPDEPDSSVS